MRAPPDEAGDYSALAVNRAGAAVAAWSSHSRRGWRVQAALRTPGNAFAAPQTIARSPRYFPWLHVAIGDSGDAIVAWHWMLEDGAFAEGVRGPVWAAVSGAQRRFGVARALGDGGDFPDVALSVAPRGRMLATWVTSERVSQHLVIAEREAGRPFAAPRTLASSLADQSLEHGGPVASIGDDGSALVAWVHASGHVAFGDGDGVLETFSRPAGADFASQALTDTPQDPEFPVLAAGSAGAVALAWTETPPSATAEGQPGKAVVRATLGSRGAPLPAATQVSASTDDATWPTAAIADDGEATVAWITGGFGSGPIKATVGA